jgi:hypothetical protein
VKDVRWRGFYVLGHHDLGAAWGVSLRYGILDDRDGGRTGVTQKLSSWTIQPVVHLSRLIRDLRPTSALYARTSHPIDLFDVKLEYRVNRSDRSVFSDQAPGQDVERPAKSSQELQLQLVWNF